MLIIRCRKYNILIPLDDINTICPKVEGIKDVLKLLSLLLVAFDDGEV